MNRENNEPIKPLAFAFAWQVFRDAIGPQCGGGFCRFACVCLGFNPTVFQGEFYVIVRTDEEAKGCFGRTRLPIILDRGT